MSAWIKQYVPNSDGTIVAEIECDDTNDLPAVNAFTFGNLSKQSFAHVIATNKVYELNSSGTWIVQDEASRMDVYTKAETDAAITAQINNLDVPTEGGSTQYIMSIRQADGLIVPVAAQSSQYPTDGNQALITSGGVYNALTPINTLLDYIQELGIKNRFPQVRRIGTNNTNAASTFTQSGVTYTVNDDGTITLTASSAISSDSIVWLYDDFSAILADNIADGTYYFITGFVGSQSTARMRIKTGPSNADYLVVAQYATVPESTYTGMNISIIVYSGFTGTITIKPMFVKKGIYNYDTPWEPYNPTGRELLDIIHKYHT